MGSDLRRYLAQAVVYGLFIALLGVFADWPGYRHFPDDKGLIKMSFTHAGDRKAACRRRSREELAKLAPNMRQSMACPRGRLPITVELTIDGDLLYRETIEPGGFSGDAPARVYRRFPVPAGNHRLEARMRDSGRAEGFDHVHATEVEVAPRQVVVIDFRAESDGFIIK